AVQNFADASGKVDRASEQIARISETIGDREEDINQFISDAKEMAGRLNQASTRVDGVLAKLDGLLGSDDTSDLMADARATLSSFRQVADTLNARIGTITDGLARFSGSGLRDIRSEERRVGKECRYRVLTYDDKAKEEVQDYRTTTQE